MLSVCAVLRLPLFYCEHIGRCRRSSSSSSNAYQGLSISYPSPYPTLSIKRVSLSACLPACLFVYVCVCSSLIYHPVSLVCFSFSLAFNPSAPPSPGTSPQSLCLLTVLSISGDQLRNPSFFSVSSYPNPSSSPHPSSQTPKCSLCPSMSRKPGSYQSAHSSGERTHLTTSSWEFFYSHLCFFSFLLGSYLEIECILHIYNSCIFLH